MEQLANSLTNRLLLRGYIDADQTDWCRYMLVCRGMNLLSLLLLIPAGALLAGWRVSLLYTACFRFLRVRTGGYHAKTPRGCLFCSVCAQTAAFWAVRQTGSFFFWSAAMLASICVIFELAPANNAALHLSPAEMAALRPSIRARSAGLLLLGEGLLLFFGGALWGGCVAAALAMDAVLLVLSACGLGVQ